MVVIPSWAGVQSADGPGASAELQAVTPNNVAATIVAAEAHYMWWYGGQHRGDQVLPRHYGFAIRPVLDAD